MALPSLRDIKDIQLRITRVESKLVRGFEELGVNISTNDNWMTVDDAQGVVYIDTLGRSIMVIRTDMIRHGATRHGHFYDLVHRGEHVGSVLLPEKGRSRA